MSGIVDADPKDIQRAKGFVKDAWDREDFDSIGKELDPNQNSQGLPACTIINALRELGLDPQRKVITQTVTYLSFTTKPFREGDPIDIYLNSEISKTEHHWSAF